MRGEKECFKNVQRHCKKQSESQEKVYLIENRFIKNQYVTSLFDFISNNLIHKAE